MARRAKTPADTAGSSTPPADHKILQYGVVVALILFLAVGVYLWLKPKPPSPTPRRHVPVVATPSYFTDVYAYVRSIADHQLVVETTITDRDGTRHARRYTVTIADTTVMTKTTQVINAGPEPITFNDLVEGDLVQVFSTENLGVTETFTATRLIKTSSS